MLFRSEGRRKGYTSTVALLAGYDPELAVAVARSLMAPYDSHGRLEDALTDADRAWMLLLDKGPEASVAELRLQYLARAGQISRHGGNRQAQIRVGSEAE